MIDITETEKFDSHLENEFSKLGFNYQEIKANGVVNLDDRSFQLYCLDYETRTHSLADGLAVVFTLQFDGDQQAPAIQSMQATVFNDSLYGKFTSLIEKRYFFPDLLVKENVVGELNALLKLKQQADKGLAQEFTRLGFDLNDLLTTAERVNENEIFLSKTIKNDQRLNAGAEVRFTFSVTNSPANQIYSIEHLTAVMRRNTPESGDRVLFEKDYFTKDAPLPTAAEVFGQIAESLKRNEIREKFGIDEIGEKQRPISIQGNSKRSL